MLPQQLPLVCTVVLEWNNVPDTQECLEALTRIEHPNHKIILVDNGSDNGSDMTLQGALSPEIDFVRSETNLGCGGGYNLGIQRALDQGADFVAIVDNDVVVEPDFVGALLSAFDDSASCVGLASPIVTRYDDPKSVWFAGAVYDPVLAFMRHPLAGARLDQLPRTLLNRVRRTAYAPSCAVLLSRRAIEQTGLMDGRLFYGHDEVDWCLRAAALGFDSVLVGRPLARHKIAVTGGTPGSSAFTPFSAYHFSRGNFLVGSKEPVTWRAATFLIGQLCIHLPYHGVHMMRAGDTTSMRAYLRGILDGTRDYWLPRLAGRTARTVPTPLPYARPAARAVVQRAGSDGSTTDEAESPSQRWVQAEGSRLVAGEDLKRLALLGMLSPAALLFPQRLWPRVASLYSRGWGLLRPSRRRQLSAGVPGSLVELAEREPDAIANDIDCANLLECIELLAGAAGRFRPDHVQLCGRKHLDAAVAAGRGAILWIERGPSSSLLSKAGLASHGYRIHHLSRASHGFSNTRLGMRFLNALYRRTEAVYLAERIDASLGVLGATRRLRDLLEANEIVSITVTDSGRRVERVPFLGGELRLASGALSLAESTGAALLPVFCYREQDRFVVQVRPALSQSEDGHGRTRSSRDIRARALDYASELKGLIRAHPESWSGWQEGNYAE